MTKELQKILIVDLNLLGDTIVFLPTLINSRKNWPDSHITYLTTTTGQEITQGLDLVDRIWISSHTEIKNIFNFIHWLWLIRKEKFNLVITSCDTPSRVALLLLLARIPIRIGFTNAKLYRLYNYQVPFSRDCHQAELNLRPLKRLGLPTKLVRPEFKINEADRKKIDSLLQEKNVGPSDLLIGIHPGSKRLCQRWPIEHFAELANVLMNKYNAKIVCIGSEQERELSELLTSLIKHKNSFINLTGKTTIKQLAYLFTCCIALICNNSGPMHLAILMGTPTVSLWGSTSQIIWGPLWDKEKHIIVQANLDCIGCGKIKCPKETVECMKLITIDMVLTAVAKIL